MEQIAQFVVEPAIHGEALLRELESECGGEVQSYWATQLDVSSPQYERCMTLLRRAGVTPRLRGKFDRTKCQCSITRKYSEAELDQCPILQVVGAHHCDHRYVAAANEVMHIECNSKLRWRQGIAAGAFEPNLLIVPQEIREQLESSGLRGAVFREVEPVRTSSGARREGSDKGRWDECGGAWWQLSASRELPAMGESAVLIDFLSDEPYHPNSRSCAVDEGLFAFPQLAFGAEVLRAFETCDIQCTHERFGTGTFDARTACRRAKVVSQRFRQLCMGACALCTGSTSWLMAGLNVSTFTISQPATRG